MKKKSSIQSLFDKPLRPDQDVKKVTLPVKKK